MAGRATNVALLGLVPAAVISGGVTFLVGSGPIAIVVIAHAVIGLSLLCLIPWKTIIVRRGLRRRRSDRLVSLLLAFAVLLALFTGLAHSTGLLLGADGITTLQVHVGAALVALVPLAVHVWRRPTRPRRTDFSRRRLLRFGLLAATAGAAYTALEAAAAVLSLPGARRRATGSYELSSGIPDGMPNTSWLFDEIPTVDPATWRVVVHVDGQSRAWSVDQLRAFGHQATVVLDCTGGWWSRQVWSEARVSALLPPGRTGTVEVSSVTGYRRRLPLTDNLLLAVDVAGSPLSEGHGAPVRLVAPGRRGFHWVKWVDRVGVDNRPWWLESPFPLQ
jgi:hypothetical protein